MKTKYFFALLLLGLAALFSVLPLAKAVTTVPAGPVPRLVPSPSAASGLPCTPLASAQDSVPVQQPIEIRKSYSDGSLYLGTIASSCWVSSEEMILFNGHQLTRFNIATGSETPIAGTEDAISGKHWASIIALSPDGHWLVWAGGVDGHSTWNAVTTDGAEHRQWPRDESITTPAIAWMQDNQHWVELRVPETKIKGTIGWEPHPDNMRVRVYSLDSPDVQDFPLQLEVPDPTFLLLPNCGKTSEFLFTADGHAWLSGQSIASKTESPSLSYIFYELMPSSTIWKLHKTFVTPKADPEHWMFDSAVHSPDGNWVIWRNYSADPGCRMNGNARLMLSRTDGSGMQVIYQGDNSGYAIEWSPDSRQIAFETCSPKGICINGICTINLDDLIASETCRNPKNRIANSLGIGPFSTAYSKIKLPTQSHIASR